MAFLPRDVIHWLDSLDLAYSIRNVRRDLSNGFIVAEILSRYFPKEINVYTYDNGLKVTKKMDNWDRISKVLKKRDLDLPQEEYEPIIHYCEGAAESFLKKLYQFLTKKNWPERPKFGKESNPHWMRPTAATISRDTELVRIVDEDAKRSKTIYQMAIHQETKKVELRKLELQQYMTMKRTQYQMLQTAQQKELEKKRKKREITEPQITEVVEIKLKSLHTSTGKKTKEVQNTIKEAQGVIEYLSDQNKEMLDEIINRDVSEEIKKPEDMPSIQFVFNNNKEISEDSLGIIFMTLKSEASAIVERLNNNFSEFKSFFTIFKVPLTDLYWKSSSFTGLVELLKTIGRELVKLDALNTETMFESIILNELVDVILQYPNKREDICQIIFSYAPMTSGSRYRFLKKIKEKLGYNLRAFMSILSIVVSFEIEEEFSEELYNLYFYYALQALDFPSPISRTHGLKILSEIIMIGFTPVLQIIGKFQSLANDDWWEVRSLILVVCSSLLLFISKEKENPQVENRPFTPKEEVSEDNLGENPQLIQDKIEETHHEDRGEDIQDIQKMSEAIKPRSYEVEETFLLDLISQLFTVGSNQNILKIGLIYIANTLNSYSQLCPRYFEVLMSVSDDIRNTVLETHPMPGSEEGYIAQNSFKYKLTGAPLFWNSVGIAKALESYVGSKQPDNFERVHVEILAGCMVQPLEEKDSDTWIRIYESLKSYLFVGLCDRDLCHLSSEVFRKFISLEVIQPKVLETSKKIFNRTLYLLYHPDRDEFCKDNLLGLFEFLTSTPQKMFQDYCYEIIKEFSEKNRNQFLKSNLVDFMNDLARIRREAIFGAGILG